MINFSEALVTLENGFQVLITNFNPNTCDYLIRHCEDRSIIKDPEIYREIENNHGEILEELEQLNNLI